LDTRNIAELQAKDGNILEIIQAVKNPGKNTIGLRKQAKNFRLESVLYRINSHGAGRTKLLVIPQQLVGDILYSHQSEPLSGHLGLSKTLAKIKQRYY